jgi:hypothetical protein
VAIPLEFVGKSGGLCTGSRGNYEEILPSRYRLSVLAGCAWPTFYLLLSLIAIIYTTNKIYQSGKEKRNHKCRGEKQMGFGCAVSL